MKPEDNNISRPYKGLHTDSSPQDQPKGTYRFGLNAVTESEDGDENFIGNEESNIACASFPTDYIPIGKVYLDNGETAIFLVKNDESMSEIGILDDNCHYTTHVNANLGFKITKQIDAVYRLRRGCERTIYFVDGENKPRIYNFDKPEDFKDDSENWDVSKFNLFKTYNNIPTFEKVEILETGQLAAGAYNFAIQYLDEDLNPTEWISVTDTIIIYNDTITSKSFSEIRGSTNKKTAYQDFGLTNKAIKLTVANLDISFPFYRIAAIESTNGSGQVNQVIFSQNIATERNIYTYTGEDGLIKGTEREIKQFNNVIEKAQHIEQIENRLILSNTEGKQIQFCKLQKYASKIRADLVTEQIVLNDINEVNNPKRGQVHLEKVGYMPGEIYSFGIVYVFEDGTTTPVYHIPGRNENYVSQMSTDNKLGNTNYLDNNSCSGESYWGTDSEGQPLAGTPIRHHRFPLRSEVNKPLYTKSGSFKTTTISVNGLFLNISGTVADGYTDIINYVVYYNLDGNRHNYLGKINTAFYDPNISSVDTSNIVITLADGTITDVEVYEIDLTSGQEVTPFSGLNYSWTTQGKSIPLSTTDDNVYTTEIFGIKFSNIDLPDLGDSKNKIIGYYIVRNKRTEENKTILDTGVLCPLMQETGNTTGEVKFVAHGQLLPNTTRIEQDAFALIHPEHRFNNKEYRDTTQYIQEGEYTVHSKNIADKITQDVQPGTSYDPKIDKAREKDTDGFDLHILSRNNNLDYGVKPNEFATSAEIKETFYLNSLFSKTVTDINNKRKDIYNISADNKIGIVQLTKNVDLAGKLPYVIMKRDLSDPYSNFRMLPYYKETDNICLFTNPTGNEIEVYNGDSYISSMKYMSSMYYDTRFRDRARKTGLLNFLIGILATIAGGLTIANTFGLGTSAGIALIGFGISQISSGIKKHQISKVYGDLYEQGLKDTVNDNDTDAVFGGNPQDDEIQWFHDSLSNLWFESSVNMNWRMGTTIGITDFLNSPADYNKQQVLTYCLDKLTTIDSENDGGRNYQGYAKAELYELNPDYLRRDAQKVFYHLGIEYDCCSNCIEKFPHRNYYSEQSFQEELTDNYRKFLPNNYMDIEGETGEITNIFKMRNNLYIHTEEALWHLPQNIQERVTGDVVSFIGTGSFFSIPPRKIIDDSTGNSGGSKHKWGTIKTPYGVFFISEKQGTIYQFDGRQLKPISNIGMSNWFKNNIPLQLDNSYLAVNGIPYPFSNNPSNIKGTGFIAVYDSRKERIIFTKRDFANITSTRPLDTALTINNSWTVSYSLKTNSWKSFHSYLPRFYVETPNKFYSWSGNDNTLWRHNVEGSYQNFYGTKYPFIIEYVSVSNPLVTRIWDYIEFITEAKKYDETSGEFLDERFITFNKALFYNSRQTTGILNLIVKDTTEHDEDYLLQQVQNLDGDSIIIDRNERNWSINQIRDLRVDYSKPMFNRNLTDLQNEYYIDKIVNSNVIDKNKNWTELESFRDKYLVIRLIFDNFDDVKLLFNYSIENEKISFR